MRLRRTDLQRRINGNLTFRASDDRLSSYAGLELLRISCCRVFLPCLLRRHTLKHWPGTDYGKVSMILLVLALLFTGGRRLRCINSLHGDPIAERFCSLKNLPTARSMARWLGKFANDSVIGLRRMNEELVGNLIRSMNLPRLAIDIDGSVLSPGCKPKGPNVNTIRIAVKCPATARSAPMRPTVVSCLGCLVDQAMSMTAKSRRPSYRVFWSNVSDVGTEKPFGKFAWMVPFFAEMFSNYWIESVRSMPSRLPCMTGWAQTTDSESSVVDGGRNRCGFLHHQGADLAMEAHREHYRLSPTG